MARSVATIKQGMINSIQADSVLSALLTSPSLTAIWNLWIYIIAVCINLTEQVWDSYLAEFELAASQMPAASAPWIQNQVFLYQYDPSGVTDTNVLTILPSPSFALGYVTVDPAFNIVTRCAVVTTGSNQVLVMVAQSSPPAQISGPAFTQLDSYLTQILPAGVNHLLFSGNSDKIAIYGTVYYKPGFGGVVETNVNAAINTYLNSLSIPSAGQILSYDGMIRVSDIIDYVNTCVGVSDFKLEKILCRADGTAIGSATVLYDINASPGVNLIKYQMAAGYAVGETTAGYTWADTLTYASE